MKMYLSSIFINICKAFFISFCPTYPIQAPVKAGLRARHVVPVGDRAVLVGEDHQVPSLRKYILRWNCSFFSQALVFFSEFSFKYSFH